MLSTLLELLWQRLKKKKKIPHRYIILSQAAVHWQQSQHCKSTILQSSVGKRLKKRKGVPALLSTSLTWDAIPSLEAEQAGVPFPDWGGVDTAWHSALCWTIFKGPLSATFWLGPESHMVWRPPGIWRQDSASLNLSWRWGSQLKPLSWEGCLLDT